MMEAHILYSSICDAYDAEAADMSIRYTLGTEPSQKSGASEPLLRNSYFLGKPLSPLIWRLSGRSFQLPSTTSSTRAPSRRDELQLPPELFIAILVDCAPIGSRNDLKPLLLVSHHFYDLIAPIFYESLLITVENPIEPLAHPESWTSLSHSCIHTLHQTFSSKPLLASYTKILVSDYDAFSHAIDINCPTLQSIFPSLVNLQRISISPSEACFHALLHSLPNIKLLTHLQLYDIWDTQIATTILRTGSSLHFLSLPRDDDPLSDLVSSNVRTLRVYQELLPLISPDRFPHLEHLDVQYSGILQQGLDSTVCRRLRTLSLSCTTRDFVRSILENLDAVEYLNTAFFDYSQDDDFQLPSLLSIPSKRIKYIRMIGITLHDTFVVQRLLEKHPSLVIVDISDDALPSSHITIFYRYFRVERGEEGPGFERFSGFRIPLPPVFRMWWEVDAVKEGVNEAYADGLGYCRRYRARSLFRRQVQVKHLTVETFHFVRTYLVTLKDYVKILAGAGSLTAILTVLDAALFFHGKLHYFENKYTPYTIPEFLLSKLYTDSLLVTLNARIVWRNASSEIQSGSEQGSGLMPSFSITQEMASSTSVFDTPRIGQNAVKKTSSDEGDDGRV
ncbi:hypothetical protein ONZ45_g10340 [Pleurotus djamor]|nr:hypothetical protein ONZ45_g10340 [Pleurotus djamor]